MHQRAAMRTDFVLRKQWRLATAAVQFGHPLSSFRSRHRRRSREAFHRAWPGRCRRIYPCRAPQTLRAAVRAPSFYKPDIQTSWNRKRWLRTYCRNPCRYIQKSALQASMTAPRVAGTGHRPVKLIHSLYGCALPTNGSCTVRIAFPILRISLRSPMLLCRAASCAEATSRPSPETS